MFKIRTFELNFLDSKEDNEDVYLVEDIKKEYLKDIDEYDIFEASDLWKDDATTFSKKQISKLTLLCKHLIKKYKIKSLLVEPIKINYEKLKENYKNCNFVSFENSAITVGNEISSLYKVNDKYIKNYSKHIPGITSFDKDHLIKHGVKKNIL